MLSNQRPANNSPAPLVMAPREDIPPTVALPAAQKTYRCSWFKQQHQVHFPEKFLDQRVCTGRHSFVENKARLTAFLIRLRSKGLICNLVEVNH